MLIKFTDVKLKQGNASNMNVTVTETDSQALTPISQENASLNTDELTEEEKATVDAFVALCKSKIVK